MNSIRGIHDKVYFNTIIFKNNISYDLKAEKFEITPFMAKLKPLTNKMTPAIRVYHLE